MYDDYPTVYETSLNLNFIYYIILAIVLLVFLFIVLISLAKIFKKANCSGISAFIPIYNIIMMLEITNSSKWYLLFLLIPGINIFFYLFVMFSLAESFKKEKIFGFGLFFLPFVFYPILGFGKSEYIGINLVAIGGKTIVSDIPRTLESKESDPILHEEKDTTTNQINISIGGGVYQKDYTNTLLEVDQNQKIPNNDVNFFEHSSSSLTTPSNDNVDSSKLSFIIPIDEEPKVIEEVKNISNIFSDKMNSVVEKKSVPAETSSSQTSTILKFDHNQDGIDTMNKKQIEESTFMTNSEIQSVDDNHFGSNSEFISCPECGAKVKSDAKVCFLCGRILN